MYAHFLTKYYFINKFDTNNIDLQDNHTIIIFRNYEDNQVNKSRILEIKNYCKKKGKKFYISNNIKLAIMLDLDGVYIPSFNKNFSHLSYSFKKKFKIIGSAHNLKEIRIKEIQKMDKIVLSSLFKKNKNYLGLNKFRLLTGLSSRKIIALGGVNKENLKTLKLIPHKEFAGISYFEQKKGP